MNHLFVVVVAVFLFASMELSRWSTTGRYEDNAFSRKWLLLVVPFEKYGKEWKEYPAYDFFYVSCMPHTVVT